MSDADAAGARIEEAKMTNQDFAELLAYLRAESSQYPKNILQIKGSEAATLVDEIERLQRRVAELERAVEEICRERATPPITRARLRHALAGVDWRKAR